MAHACHLVISHRLCAYVGDGDRGSDRDITVGAHHSSEVVGGQAGILPKGVWGTLRDVMNRADMIPCSTCLLYIIYFYLDAPWLELCVHIGEGPTLY